MFTKETIGAIIEDCMLRAKLFRERHGGKCFGEPFIRISTYGIDGGGLSTYGKSVAIYEGDRYECHDGYLYILNKERKGYNRDRCEKTLTESVAFIPYESIVSIECSVSAYV